MKSPQLAQFAIALSFCFASLISSQCQGDVIDLKLFGIAGEGLLPGNVFPGTSSTGSGGERALGILFDLDTNILSIDIEWGSENGYGDLTGEVTMLHLHGPTDEPPPNAFRQRGPLLINLGASNNFDSSGTGGGLADDYFISNSDVDALLGGRTYINVHTNAYPFGEIRGYIVRADFVPEPTSALLLGSMGIGMLTRRRR